MVVLLSSAAAKLAPAQSSALPDSASIRSILESGRAPTADGHAVDGKLLVALYAPRQYQPVWTDSRQQSFQRALDQAEAQGLDPVDYAVGTRDPAARELSLTDAFIRYARALAQGRVPPASFEKDWYIDSPGFDPAKAFEAAIAGDVATVLVGLAPHETAYERLQLVLAHYRALAKTGWPVLAASSILRAGVRGEPVQRLRERLTAEGYAASGTREEPIYDKPLAEAVARFQATHGIAVSGVTDAETRTALNVTAAERVHQIVLNLERWRSLPRIEAASRIEVNVAAATAVLYQDGQAVETSRVIVGSLIHHTPVLRAEMQSILFNPSWYVPHSIYVKELRPAIERDPLYMERGGYVFREVNGASQLVQLPGPKNALGQIKFEIPNPADVYMHDTPDRKYFARAKRFLSHGCVRVEGPKELARLLLHSPNWSSAAIDAAIASGKTERVMLAQPLPVYLLYWTAFVDPDGTAEFRDDVYGRDRRLDQALAAYATPPRVAGAIAPSCTG